MSIAEWILSIASTLIGLTVGALIRSEVAKEHRLTALETKFESWDDLLQRVEKKVDELVSKRRPRGS